MPGVQGVARLPAAAGEAPGQVDAVARPPPRADVQVGVGGGEHEAAGLHSVLWCVGHTMYSYLVPHAHCAPRHGAGQPVVTLARAPGRTLPHNIGIRIWKIFVNSSKNIFHPDA